MPLDVIAFTGGKHIPGARFRVRQYVDHLAASGIRIHESYTRLGAYPPHRRGGRWLWGAGALAARIPGVIASHRFHVTLFQRELLSTYVTLESLTKSPRVLDVDDAIWIYRDGVAARRLAETCDRIVCGNAYLADRFSRWNLNIDVIPTPVDTDVLIPQFDTSGEARRTIGWIGTSSNLRYLALCVPAIASVLDRHRDVDFCIVSDLPPPRDLVRRLQARFVRWSPEVERLLLPSFTIGVMPLPDTEWARGKCSFKMLQYMACGVPVVVSPVGMNVEVLKRGQVGLGAATEEEWEKALETLLEDPATARAFGEEGRRVAVTEFSVSALAPRMAQTLQTAAGCHQATVRTDPA